MRPIRRASLGLAALTCAAGLTPLAAQAAQAQPTAPTWTPTLTGAVSFAGTRLGATDAARTLHLTLALAPRNVSAMSSRLRAIYTPGSAQFHHFLSAAQWRADYAPTQASLSAVTDYLRSAGFTAISATGNRLAVQATGTVAQAEQAFATHLVDFRHGHATVFGNTTAARVPTSLASIVTSVIGLNDLPADLIKAQRATTTPAGADSGPGLYPAQLAHTYDADKATSGRKVAVAVLTQGAFKPVRTALRYAEVKEHATKVPLTLVPVGAQSHDQAGVDEFDMDTQVSSIAAGSVKRLYAYNIGGLLDSEIVAAFSSFVSQNKAVALSASIGGCEYNSFLDGSELFTDTLMQEGAMQGQSLFASSGDEGDACAFVVNLGAPVGVPQVEWPASGTFDTAVGGTSLITDKSGNRTQELAWLGSGGGISELENPGWWTAQTNAVQDAEYVTGGRAVPDVALDADPNLATPVNVYVGKQIVGVGGTSLSSPLMLGFWARLEAAHRGRLGLASIALYDVYDKVNPGITTSTPVGLDVVVPTPAPAAVPGLTDIQLGTNGLYPALPGYDMSTGLGAPDVAALAKVIK